jgi:biotin-dependent carboxylase-like uncharacterized protein
MSALTVEACGPGTTVQDAGRTGFRRFGVSTAGAMDRLALALANVLVGNHPGTAAVEFTLVGGRFRTVDTTVAVAAVGAFLTVDGRPIPAGSGALAGPGASIAVGPARGGVYAYLAVGGGIDSPPAMGSRSVHRRSAIGGGPLGPGDMLPLGPDGADVPRRLPLPEPTTGPIRLMFGPQDDHFTDAALAALTATDWTVMPRSDRMGCRLDGAVLPHARGFNIVSDGVVPGSVQVPGDGRPIVLMRDCQTTGGYPKIATVIGPDLDRLAQVPPGGTVRFAAVARTEAVAAAAALRQRIDGLAALARPAGADPSSEDLLALNLIGGVVDATAVG